jgi:hypothetical protein
LVCKADAGVNDALVAADARKFYLPAYLSSRGWIALRLDLGRIDWDEVKQLLFESYRLIAPKGLVAKI